MKDLALEIRSLKEPTPTYRYKPLFTNQFKDPSDTEVVERLLILLNSRSLAATGTGVQIPDNFFD